MRYLIFTCCCHIVERIYRTVFIYIFNMHALQSSHPATFFSTQNLLVSRNQFVTKRDVTQCWDTSLVSYFITVIGVSSGNPIKLGNVIGKSTELFHPFERDRAYSNNTIAFHCTRCGLMTDAFQYMYCRQIASISCRENWTPQDFCKIFRRLQKKQFSIKCINNLHKEFVFTFIELKHSICKFYF